MNLQKAIAHGAIAVVLGGAALGPGAVTASADPDWGGPDHHQWADNHGNDNEWWADHHFGWNRWNDNDWNHWWRVNKWRNDDRPPWGWGPPPAVHWRGHPPEWIDYWGYRVHPSWDPGLHVFGFWLFGVFIPVFVV
jgi:hypothetical protein